MIAGRCTLPPAGWTCTREPGHAGPCAAVPLCACAETPCQFHGEDGAVVAVWQLARDLAAALRSYWTGDESGPTVLQYRALVDRARELGVAP